MELVELEGWPIRREEDRGWLSQVQPIANPEHFKLLQQQAEWGVKRVKPEELFAACTLAPLPAEHGRIALCSPKILEKLDSGGAA